MKYRTQYLSWLFMFLFFVMVTLSQAHAQDSLVAFYPFSGSAVDSSGFGHDGTVYGATFTVDRFGHQNSAFHFDGDDDFIDVGSSEELSITGDLSISVWLNSASFENLSNGIITYQGDNSDNGISVNALYKVNITDSSRIRYVHEDAQEDDFLFESSNFLFERDRWYNLVLVRDISEKTIFIFVDGEQIDSTVFENSPEGGELATLRIGENHGTLNSERFFNGVLDDIRIYNSVLTDSTILDIYNEGGWPLSEDTTGIPKDTLVAYYPFSGSAIDLSGFDNNGIIHGAQLTFDRFGNPNSAYSFDGINDFIEIPHNPLFNSEAKTIQFWFRKNSTISDTPGYVDMEGILWKAFDTGFDRAFSFSIATEEPPFTFYLKVGNSTDSLLTAITEDTIMNSSWYHAAGVITKDWISIYIDGVLVDSVSNDGQIINNTAPIVIAKASVFSASTRYFEGVIDDIQIHNYALNSSRIWESYAVGGWPLPEDSTIVPNDTLAGYFPFNGDAEDESGYGNHGEVFGATLTTDRFGNADKAYSFDGVDDYILVDNPKALHSAKNLSLSFWAKGSATDTSFAGLVSAPNMQPFGVGMDDGDRILFSISSDNIPLNLVTTGLNDGADEWHQYVTIYRANEFLKLFKDGKEIGVLYGTIPGFMDTDSTGVYIGALPVTNQNLQETFYFSGSIDDIRFYNYALSSDSVVALYEKEKTSIVSNERELFLPEKYSLYQNYPNPFNPRTNIRFDIPQSGKVTLKVYDINGRLVASLVDGIKSAGTYQVSFDASRLASGIYLYELKTSGFSSVKKFTLIK